MNVLHLASSTNHEGYLHALAKTWRKCGLDVSKTPSKSSLSEFRDKVSYTFFEEIFRNGLADIEEQRKKIRGFYVYSIDGDHLDAAPSEELLSWGFRGYQTKRNKRETHYLKIYSVQAYDVVNGLIKDFRYSTQQREMSLAWEMAGKLEQNSIAIYDRLHCTYPNIDAHLKAGNYFLIRARFGRSGQREIRKFANSKKTGGWVTWKPQGTRWLDPAVRVRLVKIKHPKTKEIMIYATNLTEDQFTDKEIAELYLRRWDIEGSFRDLTATLKMEQWHSKKLNGILQEIYALLWLVNKVKFACFSVTSKAKDWLMLSKYRKCNFKLCISLYVDNIDLLLSGQATAFVRIIDFWIHKTIEQRERLSRKYPRVTRRRGQDYAWANTVPRRP